MPGETTMPNGTHLFFSPDSHEEQHPAQLRFQFKTLLWKLRQATLARLPEDFKLGEPSPATRGEGQDLPIVSLIGISRKDDLWTVAQTAGLED